MAQAGPTLGNGEHEILSFASLYKKSLGKVLLSNQRVVWTSTDAQSKVQKVEMPWSTVKDHMVSPANVPKAMIKINPSLNNMPSLVFEVLESGLISAAEILAIVRSTIARILRSYSTGIALDDLPAAEKPGISDKSKDSSNQSHSGYKRRRENDGVFSGLGGNAFIPMDPTEDVKRKAALLASDSTLRLQYADIVEGGILSEAEFWAGRKRMLDGEVAAQRAQRQGTRSALGADVRPAIEGNKKIFKLTPRDIHQIFLMYPAVERAYKAKVPTELSEKEFWVKYFQSQYYLRDRGGSEKSRGTSISAGDDMFSRYAAEYEEEKKLEMDRAKGGNVGEATGQTILDLSGTQDVDPTINIASQWADYHSREVDDRPPEERASAVDGQAIINRLNRHAALVMKNRHVLHAERDNPTKATDLPELHEPHDLAVQPLHLANQALYSGSGKVGSESLSKGNAPQNVPFSLGKLNLSRALPPPSKAAQILATCTKSTSTSLNSTVQLASYPQEFVTRMHRHFQVIGELLRHFYSEMNLALKQKADDLGKVERLIGKMEGKYEELQALRKSLPRDAHGSLLSALIKPLLDSLDHAFEMYEQTRTDKCPDANVMTITRR